MDEFFSDFWDSLAAALEDIAASIVVNAIDLFAYIAGGLLEGLDYATDAAARWNAIPADWMGMVQALGIIEALTIVVSAISLRFALTVVKTAL